MLKTFCVLVNTFWLKKCVRKPWKNKPKVTDKPVISASWFLRNHILPFISESLDDAHSKPFDRNTQLKF